MLTTYSFQNLRCDLSEMLATVFGHSDCRGGITLPAQFSTNDLFAPVDSVVGMLDDDGIFSGSLF